MTHTDCFQDGKWLLVPSPDIPLTLTLSRERGEYFFMLFLDGRGQALSL
jgi:hypothetical protein